MSNRPITLSREHSAHRFEATGFNFLYERTGPQPVTDVDLIDVAEQLHDRLDVIELAQIGDDDRVLERLPPYVRLLLKADPGRADTWQLIGSFADENTDPWVIVEILLAYGQPATAARVTA